MFRAKNLFTAQHLTKFTSLDLSTEIEEDYYKVVDFLERLMLFIFRGLNEHYNKETELIHKVYPVQPFKLPVNVPRLALTRSRYFVKLESLLEITMFLQPYKNKNCVSSFSKRYDLY